jgi:hypothetical protein
MLIMAFYRGAGPILRRFALLPSVLIFSGATIFAQTSLSIITTSPLPNAMLGSVYNAQLEARGGTAPYTWSVTLGTVPPGLMLRFDGLLEGVANSASVSAFQATVTDSVGNSASAMLGLSVVQPQNCTYTLSPTSATAPTSPVYNPVQVLWSDASINVVAAPGCGWSAVSNSSWIDVYDSGGQLPGGQNRPVRYFVYDNPGPGARTGSITVAGTTFPVRQIAPGSARVWKMAVFRDGLWIVDRNGNGSWDGPPADAFYTFGQAGDIPVTGDWNGDGRWKIGLFRNGCWYLDYNGNGQWDGPQVDRAFYLGQAGDTPVVGDWNGDGRTKAGVFRSGLWVLDYNGNGLWDGLVVDRAFYLGQAGDTPVVGDWNGDGRTKAGVFRSGLWVLDYNGNGVWDGPAIDRVITLGGQTIDQPVVGDWNGDGRAKVGFFRNSMSSCETTLAVCFYLDIDGNGVWDDSNLAGWLDGVVIGRSGIPMTGDWKGRGQMVTGTFSGNIWYFFPNWADAAPPVAFGIAGDIPVPGPW